MTCSLFPGSVNRKGSTNTAKLPVRKIVTGNSNGLFSLSDTIDENNITAVYKDGIVSLTMQKTEKALPKQVKIEVK